MNDRFEKTNEVRLSRPAGVDFSASGCNCAPWMQRRQLDFPFFRISSDFDPFIKDERMFKIAGPTTHKMKTHQIV